MFEPIADLRSARILLTNDDGIHAPGLRLLEDLVRDASDDVWVVAPETEQSGAGHSLSLNTPLRVRALDERRYAVSGTPTDCVLMGVSRLLGGRRPDLVLSGINVGANLGDNIVYSGTVAAAIEGTLLGVPSVALSQVYAPGEEPPWETASAWTLDVVRRVTAQGWPRGTVINVNFPAVGPEAVGGLEVTTQGRRRIAEGMEERHDPRGRAYYWIRRSRSEEDLVPGTDIEAVRRGAVSVTPLTIDLTDHAAMTALRRVLR